MKNIEWCVLCDSIIEPSPSHRVVESAGNRKVIVDGERAHLLLKGRLRTLALRKAEEGTHAEVVLLVKQAEAPIEQPIEAQVVEAPVPVEEPTTSMADTDWFDSLVAEGGVQ